MLKKLSLLLTLFVLVSTSMVPVRAAREVPLTEAERRNLGILFVDPGTACDPTQTIAPTTPVPVQPTPPPTGGSGLAKAVKVDAFDGPQITPTAIILHWTAGQYDKDPDGLVQILKSRTRQVQLYVDDSGTLYQLTKTLETKPIQTVPDEWNNATIGIEIESGNFGNDPAAHENDLLNNAAQYATVLQTVRELMAKYNIQNTADIASKKGIFGHYDIQPGNTDPGPRFMQKIRADLNNSTVTPTTSTKGKIYVIGDSLTVGMRDSGLDTELKAKGWTPLKINAEGGKTLGWGVEQINADAAIIKDADAILIGLGTNNLGSAVANDGSPAPLAGGEDAIKAEMQKVVDAVKKAKEGASNPTIKIFWTDIYMDGPHTSSTGSYDLNTATTVINGALNKVAATNNISVIPWSKSTIATSAVPKPTGDGIHPTGQYLAMARFVAESLATAAAPTVTANGAGACCSAGTGSSTNLTGNDNEAKIWNYLIGKGMTPIQAAGAHGNIKHESASTFNPKIVEYGWGFPKEMDTVPPNVGPAGQPGYGLIQWTSPGRKDGLRNFAAKDPQKRPVYDLGLQLDWMWQELSTTYKSRALDPILASNDLATVVAIWQNKYEVGTAFAPRMKAAQAALAKFGSQTAPTPNSNTAVTTTTGTDGCATTPGAGTGTVNADGFSFPVSPQRKSAHRKVVAMSALPCGNSGGCHHKGPAGCCSPAFDISVHSNPVGTPVYAISDGKVLSVNDGYDGHAGCFTIQMQSSKDNFIYAYLHISKPVVKVGDQVKGGAQLAEIGRTQCARNTYPHLHIDRGCIRGGVPQRGGSTDCRDPGMIPLINTLFNGLPE